MAMRRRVLERSIRVWRLPTPRPLLYAANFRHGTVDVYDQNFNEVNSFTDD